MGDKGDEVSRTNESRDHPGRMEVTLTLRCERLSKESETSALADGLFMLKVCFQRKPLKAVHRTSCAPCSTPLHSAKLLSKASRPCLCAPNDTYCMSGKGFQRPYGSRCGETHRQVSAPYVNSSVSLG